ncbi:MAG: hypothetical protein OXI39_05260 [Gemmatimonadota bacterium]|uniref:hypothetical protein n=1 Tax=Candidatus Palauibacter scopulicola TaxID=3056741 RepID=UPI00239A7944|nr:hypothetical protein [Candidatus Palauibacter scopulicola]MDE2662396.1 hypothetical protein [Candidatus Palauibacter scopulicola]
MITARTTAPVAGTARRATLRASPSAPDAQATTGLYTGGVVSEAVMRRLEAPERRQEELGEGLLAGAWKVEARLAETSEGRRERGGGSPTVRRCP